MIEFANVSASYDDGRTVLDQVSFRIEDGAFVAFVGSNGAGKSTTMRLVNGLLKPTAGEVLIDGASTRDLKTSELARRVGFLFQNPDRQICCNTVREELMFGFVAQGRADAEAERAVDAVIERFGFDAQAEPYLLNRGTRQLLALASVVVLDPPVLVLDEPTTGLDFRECRTVMEAVSEMNAHGTTVIMVCHDMEVVGDYAHRVIAMAQGRVVTDGPTFEVLRDPAVRTRACLRAPQVAEVSMQLVLDDPALAFTAVAQANTLDEMQEAIADVYRRRAAERPASHTVCQEVAR